jgi:anaerobic selenocysteine-containing dehydrogenase
VHILAELAVLPEDMSVRQWVAHAGLDPRTFESGTSVHKRPRMSKVGNSHLRSALYMPALVAVQREPRVRAFYDALLAADRLGLADGQIVRLSTRRGSAEVPLEVTATMQPGHVSLPNGEGMDYEPRDGAVRRIGVPPNELTGSAERDFLAGTPWHKHVPARVERIE